jgi:predicted nucleotidyltransferase
MLETLLGSKLRAKVLGWLFSHPDERYYVRQLTSLVKEDSTNVSRELSRLEKTGILLSTIEGKQKYYQANRKSPIFDDLHGLIIKTAGVADVLRSALIPAQKRIRLAFIFGSLATGTENRRSDVDIMVVGTVSFEKVISLLHPAEEKLRREINSVVYPIAEFKKKVKEDHYFVTTVLDDQKIFLVGDQNTLQGLSGKNTVLTK